MAYLAIMVTAVAFVLWYSTVASLGAGRVGLLTGMAPVSAAMTGIVTGSRAPSPLVWTGILVVISGLAAGLWSRPTPGQLGPVATAGMDTHLGTFNRRIAKHRQV
jgi:drug/metabolite transporter (DMT)-like permease